MPASASWRLRDRGKMQCRIKVQQMRTPLETQTRRNILLRDSAGTAVQHCLCLTAPAVLEADLAGDSECVVHFSYVLLVNYGALPDLRRYDEVWLGLVWEAEELTKQQKPRYHISEQAIHAAPCWIVSLRRATKRRESLLASLTRENLTCDIIDAIDARAGLPDEIHELFSPRIILKIHKQGRDAAIARAEVAAALSHLHLLHRAVKEERDVVFQI